MAKKLTDIVLKDAKANPGQRYDIHDASGLSVRIGAKAKNFFWRYRKDGKQRRMVLGSYPATSLAEARQRLAEARAQLAEGKDPALTQRETKRAYNEAETVADLTHAYLQRWAKAKKKASSVAEDERLIRTMVLPAIGDMKVVDVTRRTLADLIAKEYARIVANGGKGVSANRLRSLLSKMFMCALKWGWIETTPAVALDAPAVETAKDRTLTDEEIRGLFELLQPTVREMEERTVIALLLILVTGQRPGEIAAMRRDAIDENQGIWTIGDTKAGRPHVVPLSPLAADLINRACESQSDPSPFVFPARGKAKRAPHIHSQSLSHAATRLSKQVGERWSAHDLRRTALTGMARLGVDRFIVSRVANHADRDVTGQHYDRHDYMEKKREALDGWGAGLRQKQID